MIKTPSFLGRRRLVVQLASWLFVASLVPVLAIYASFQMAKKDFRERALSRLVALCDNHAERIEAYAAGRIRDATAAGLNPELGLAMERYASLVARGGTSGLGYRAFDQEFRLLVASQTQVRGYDDLLLIGLNGEIVFSIKRETSPGINLRLGPQKDSALARVFETALTLLGSEISDFDVSPIDRRPAAFVAAPIFGHGALVGVLAYAFDNEEIKTTVNDLSGLGDTGETLVGSVRGDRVVILTAPRLAAQTAFPDRIPLGSQTNEPLEHAAHGERGTGVVVDYRGMEVYAAWQYLPLFRWGMITKMDTSEVLAPLANLRRIGVFSALLSLALLSLIALLMARSVVVPVTALLTAAHRFRAHDFAARVPETGPPEIAELGRALNHMAADLQESYALLKQNVTELATAVDEHQRTERALRESEGRLHDLFDDAPVGYHELDSEGRIVRVNRTELELLGYTEEEMLGHSVVEYVAEPLVALAAVKSKLAGELPPGKMIDREYRRKDGSTLPVVISDRLIVDDSGKITGIRSSLQDITDRRAAEAERERLQSRLLQAEKMDSVGRLAGGVAHDFNNMLGVILGHTEMAKDQLGPTHPLSADLEEIRKAAERSANLTRQLLAFARRQTVTPELLDLNATVDGVLTMLGRLIGENIRLDWHPGANLWPIKMDPSQIDQLLANLCINARDAIAGVGRITIETTNATVDDAYCANHAGSTVGDYVRLAVSDTGCGMDEQTQAHLFEPFFTTKAVGEGTGLGLATVYGIVQQNSGFINVYSEPGLGTTLTLHLPRHAGDSAQPKTNGTVEAANVGHETVLVVEDEPGVLRLTTRILERLGYRVLAAGTPGDAIRLAEEHAGEIHLLMTDVVMPEMNGRDLANKLLSSYPAIKCLFTSGYTADVIASNGILDSAVHFIPKPFSMKDLAAKVRDVLDGD